MALHKHILCSTIALLIIVSLFNIVSLVINNTTNTSYQKYVGVYVDSPCPGSSGTQIPIPIPRWPRTRCPRGRNIYTQGPWEHEQRLCREPTALTLHQDGPLTAVNDPRPRRASERDKLLPHNTNNNKLPILNKAACISNYLTCVKNSWYECTRL